MDIDKEYLFVYGYNNVFIGTVYDYFKELVKNTRDFMSISFKRHTFVIQETDKSLDENKKEDLLKECQERYEKYIKSITPVWFFPAMSIVLKPVFKRFDSIDKRFDSIERTLDSIERTLDYTRAELKFRRQ